MNKQKQAQLTAKAAWLNREARATGSDCVYTVTRDGIRTETGAEQRLRTSLGKGDKRRLGRTDKSGEEYTD